ncbi:MAG TPA: glycosyltransferase family 2 protein [Solirubrobacterales bacterium]|nr:glycosyltransferase family 2 protein [Solirubrobacterales bacterium]
MAKSAPATSVVVSTYDDKRFDELSACIEGLEAQVRSPLETIVVVDHNEALLERVRNAFPAVEAIPNQRPRGLAGARNSGIDVAAGEIVAFVDDDARPEPEWLQEIEACFEQPAAVGAGGALLPRWEGPEPAWFPREFYWVFGCSYTGLPEKLGPIRNPIGANMAVRTEVLREVGGFREGGGEGAADAPSEIRARGVVRAAGNIPDDTDLAIRVKQRLPEAVWLYQPSARVLHTVTAERTTLSYFLRRCYEEGVGKANLSRVVGADEGLSSERRHLLEVLPLGVLRGIRDALRGDGAGALRAGAIVVGLFASATGFLVASAKNGLRRGSDKD